MFNRRAFCLLAAGLPALRAQGPGPSEIKIDELKQKHDRGEKLFYLDVREPKELEELGTLRGYVNIPLGQIEARLKEIPRDRPVVVF
jgi:rhodanese-related sulfurtransferase